MEISLDTVNIAISAINVWREKIKREQGFNENRRFNSDTRSAINELEKIRKEF